MKWVFHLLFVGVIGASQPANAQTYQYNDRVTSQGVKSESFLKSPTYNERVTGQEFKSNSYLKRNNYNDRPGRANNLAPQGYRQKSFLPRQTKNETASGSKPAKRAPVMPLRPKGDNSNSGSIKKIPNLKKGDFAAPKTDGGNTPFDRYEVAVPDAPKLDSKLNKERATPAKEKTTSSPKPRLSPATPPKTHAPPAPSSTHRAPDPPPSPPSG